MAFQSALHGPRWNNGYRPDATGQQPVMYPPTPTVPFPISLAGREDPFSRAVSPIHGAFDQAMNGLKPQYPVTPAPVSGMGGGPRTGMRGGPRDSVIDSMIQQGMIQAPPNMTHAGALGNSGGISASSTISPLKSSYFGDNINVTPSSISGHGHSQFHHSNSNSTSPFDAFSDPFSPDAISQFNPPHQSISAPTSPRQKNTELQWPGLEGRPGIQRSSSTEPVIPSSHRLYNIIPPNPNTLFAATTAHGIIPNAQGSVTSGMVNGNALQSPAMVALKKIRKPSLRTLMSHGGSQAGSRPVSPIQESPTLFNQPMSMSLDDDETVGMQLNAVPPQAWFAGLSHSHPQQPQPSQAAFEGMNGVGGVGGVHGQTHGGMELTTETKDQSTALGLGLTDINFDTEGR